MVQSTGVLIYIHCIGLKNGTTNITIYDAGVTNDTQYLPLKVKSGSVTINGIMENQAPQDSPPPDYQPLNEPEKNYETPLSYLVENVIIILIAGLIIVFIFGKFFL
jgi:hypothetical protein